MTTQDYPYSNSDVSFTGSGTDDTLAFANVGGAFDWRNFSFVKEGDDLLIYADNGNTATVTNHFLSDAARIETLSFADGSSIDLTAANINYTETDPAGGYLIMTGLPTDDLVFGGRVKRYL